MTKEGIRGDRRNKEELFPLRAVKVADWASRWGRSKNVSLPTAVDAQSLEGIVCGCGNVME